jgi:hypothetical protein
MSNLDRRIERLEEKLGAKHKQRLIYITNLPSGPEDPCTVELFPGLWAFDAGGVPFTEEEIRNLRAEHNADYESSKARF